MLRPVSKRVSELAEAFDPLAERYGNAPFAPVDHDPASLFIEPRLVTKFLKKLNEDRPPVGRPERRDGQEPGHPPPSDLSDLEPRFARLYENAADASRYETRPLGNYLNQGGWSVTLSLLGCPGGGKSWCLRHVAAGMARSAAAAPAVASLPAPRGAPNKPRGGAARQLVRLIT